jgi:hypothetical protein
MQKQQHIAQQCHTRATHTHTRTHQDLLKIHIILPTLLSTHHLRELHAPHLPFALATPLCILHCYPVHRTLQQKRRRTASSSSRPQRGLTSHGINWQQQVNKPIRLDQNILGQLAIHFVIALMDPLACYSWFIVWSATILDCFTATDTELTLILDCLTATDTKQESSCRAASPRSGSYKHYHTYSHTPGVGGGGVCQTFAQH